MVKYLVIRFSSIGDIVLTTPVLRSLNEQLEEASVQYLTKPAFAEILANNPHIQKVHVLKNSLSDTIRELENEEFDYIIDLQNNIKSIRIKRSLRRMYFTVDKLNFKKWVYVNFKINKLPDKHIVDRYLDTLRLFDVSNDQKGLDYYLSENDKKSLSCIPESFNNGYVCLVIGANHETKKLTTAQLSHLIEKINKPVVMIGGMEDQTNGEIIIKANSKKDIFNGCGKWSINESAAVIKESLCVITHDTGMMHISAAFKKDIITIWGNTLPAFGMYAYKPGKKSINIEVPDLPCRPCSKLGKKKCPKSHFKCMLDQDLDKISHQVNLITT
ncbi:MAG TPA: glycosyltransferase family 9 protein [Bacteroidales bacterium]|nr:glycosyltransferase family 9 protein [Bacteroidales bacterium]